MLKLLDAFEYNVGLSRVLKRQCSCLCNHFLPVIFLIWAFHKEGFFSSLLTMGVINILYLSRDFVILPPSHGHQTDIRVTHRYCRQM